MHRIAVLDDYQSVAADFADWSQVPEPAEVVEFHDHLADQDALVARLEPFDVVVAMRERTRVPAQPPRAAAEPASCSSPPACGTSPSTSPRPTSAASPSAAPAASRTGHRRADLGR